MNVICGFRKREQHPLSLGKSCLVTKHAKRIFSFFHGSPIPIPLLMNYCKKEGETEYFGVGIDLNLSPKLRFLTPSEAKSLSPIDAILFTKNTLGPTDEEEAFVPIARTEQDVVLNNVTVKAKRRDFTNSACQEMHVTVEGMTDKGDVLMRE